MVPPVRLESSLVLNLESSFTSQDPTFSITGLTSVAPISGGYGDGPVHQVLAVHAWELEFAPQNPVLRDKPG